MENLQQEDFLATLLIIGFLKRFPPLISRQLSSSGRLRMHLPVCTLTVDFPAYRAVGNKCLCLSFSVWYFVGAVSDAKRTTEKFKHFLVLENDLETSRHQKQKGAQSQNENLEVTTWPPMGKKLQELRDGLFVAATCWQGFLRPGCCGARPGKRRDPGTRLPGFEAPVRHLMNHVNSGTLCSF